MSGRWILIRGLVAVGIGVFAFARPAQLFVTILVFGGLAIVAGILAIVHALRLSPDHSAGRWPLLAEGIVGIGAGILAFQYVHKTIFLAYTVAFWALGLGAAILAISIVLRRSIPTAWLWGTMGALVAALGLAILVDPHAPELGPAYLIGLVATAAGVAQLVVGYGMLRHGTPAALKP